MTTNFIISHLDWLALFIGTVGTVIWAHNGKLAKYCGVFWFISSLIWMFFSYMKGLPALGARDCISTILYLYGGYRWLRNPDVKK